MRPSKPGCALLLFLFSMSAAAADSQCRDIASTLKEYSISARSSTYLSTIFDQYCEQSGDVKNLNVGLDVVVKAIPIKFQLGSSSETMKNFCKTYASTISSSSQEQTYEEKLATKALDVVALCMQLQAADGTVITHSILNKASLDFYLQGGKNPIKFDGLTPSANVTCQGQVNGTLKTFGPQTSLTISKSQSIHCMRTPRKDKGVDVYDEGSITLSTNNPAYQVLWPKDERLPEDMASNIETNEEHLRGSIAEVKTYLSQKNWHVVGPKTVKQTDSQPLDVPADEGFCFLSFLSGYMAGDGQVIGVVNADGAVPTLGVSSDLGNTGLIAKGTCIKFTKPNFVSPQ